MTDVRVYAKLAHFTRRGTQNDSWGLSQGLAGSQGICCRRGLANRGTGEEYPVTVVITPKVRLREIFRAK